MGGWILKPNYLFFNKGSEGDMDMISLPPVHGMADMDTFATPFQMNREWPPHASLDSLTFF